MANHHADIARKASPPSTMRDSHSTGIPACSLCTRDNCLAPHRALRISTDRSEERRVGKKWRSLCDWSSDVCSSDLRNRAADSPQQINVAENAFAQWQTITLISRVKHLRLQQCEIHIRRAFRRAAFARETIA